MIPPNSQPVKPNRDFLLREWYAVKAMARQERHRHPVVWSAVHYLEARQRLLAQMIVELEQSYEPE
jgi:hypothetical protein